MKIKSYTVKEFLVNTWILIFLKLSLENNGHEN